MTTSPLSPFDFDPRRHARALYWQGWRIARIAQQLGVKPATVHSWKRRDGWHDTDPTERIAVAIETRLQQLIAKDTKEGRDYKEIDLLGRQLERLARVGKYQQTGKATDLNPKLTNRNANPKRPPSKNAISEAQHQTLRDAFFDSLFDYQRTWYRAGQTERIRNLLKSRQIGATYYFAREALLDALDTGRNQIFLSASKAQAFQFRSYIVDFAKVADIELKGEVIKLPNEAELIFLGTNSRTAQSYHGNLYLDEYFWIPRYQELRKVASGMASQKRWRQTYFSTPSALSHEAYPFWSGALYNRGRAKAEQIRLDISHAALAAGRRCEDGQWRQIVTIEDALRHGCDLFDLDQLKREYSPDEFAQLFQCQFIDDGNSVFSFTALQRCMVDSWELWTDWKPFSLRPFGQREVWLGYDPNGGTDKGDSAGLVIVAPPAVPGGPFRILERHQFKGADYEAQADFIRQSCQRFNVTYLGMDTTSIGSAVYQLVKQFRPDTVAFSYNVELKTKLVLKALNIIQNGRLQFDAGHTDIPASFMAIKKTLTASGRQATYVAGRSEDVSHADLAWATMHALFNEPLEGATATNGSILEIY
ncbi:terminase ATPase subunit family protein [Chitinivorax sp. B]|uniref:terminase ATPase subunit family protein n=1 Tax=Chitinivorax sp. B TaxID=2502235 RepID=UPI0010F51CD4|nr:terminase ATPase subunit family protein [Chitinivorax sp. B]